ncbi:MAG: hypothetical protein AAFY22_00035 [Pseudomonadota bacterium]
MKHCDEATSDALDRRVMAASPAGRRAAPRARALTKPLYQWSTFKAAMAASLIAVSPFLVAAFLAPALMTTAPAGDIIAPIARARAFADGALDLTLSPVPFQLLIFSLADMIAAAPGRIHLVAKAIVAALIALPLAFFAARRFSLPAAAAMTGVVAAGVLAPLAGAGAWTTGLLIAAATPMLTPPATGGARLAIGEGVLAGLLLFCLWLAAPVVWIAGLAALTAAPFLSGRAGPARYLAALMALLACAGAGELLAPGLAMARAEAGAALLTDGGAWGMLLSGIVTGQMISTEIGAADGLVASVGVVLFLAAVFGGSPAWRSWAAALGFLVIAVVAVGLAAAPFWPLLLCAAVIATFSTGSPFYDGVFDRPQPATVAIAGAAGALTLFWCAAFAVDAGRQFARQAELAERAPRDTLSALALIPVTPAAPLTITALDASAAGKSVAGNRFGGNAFGGDGFNGARRGDPSAILLAAAREAERWSQTGADVAILANADIACVISAPRRCFESGAAAAHAAAIVVAPRVALDALDGTAGEDLSVGGHATAEALLYTHFKKVSQNQFWDIWVRRGHANPAAAE